MKKLFFALITFSLFSCGEAPSKESPAEKVEEVRVSKFEKLLTKYKDISFDTLEVFAMFYMEKKGYKFSGAELNAEEMKFLPDDIGSKEAQSFFACYKFPMDATRTGLITRCPGEYSANSVKLLILDTKLDSIVSFFELTELSGDAGDMWQKTSWLYRNNNQQYRAFLFQELTHDRSVDDEPDTTIERTNNYFLVDFSRIKPDTVSTDTVMLTSQFAGLLKKRTPAE
jgi:hypothetical protein